MPYTYSLVPPSPSWLSISTINNQGVVTANKSQVPIAGYQGTIRVMASDGTNTQFIDRPIRITAKGSYAPSYKLLEVIESGSIASSAMIDFSPSEPVVIATTAIASSAMIDTVQTISGPTGDWDNMALIFETTNSQLSTKPSATGTAGEVRNVWRRQQFVSFLASGLTNTQSNEVLDCTIERSQVWQWRDQGAGFGEWLLTTQNEIFLDITAVDGTPIEFMYGSNPRNLGIRADFVGQRITYRQASQTAFGEWGYSSYRARITTSNTGLPTGVANRYWDWENQAMYATGN